jgi:hypothetical protein
MANLLARDEELFKKIEEEHIQVSPILWTIIYQYIGDCVIAISFLVRYYIDNNMGMPKADAKQVLVLVKRIVDIIEKLTHHELIKDDEKDGLLLAVKLGNLNLDPITDDLFGNYVRNDIHMIDLIVTDFTDPLDTRELMPVENIQKILNHIHTTRLFMERLRQATSQKKGNSDRHNSG